MKTQSFIRIGQELQRVDVELSLTPGLPQITFLGLPDAALRESAIRIRSALREQDFKIPPAHQILVHLKPTHLRKSSRGLDLAVAAALLWETGQLPLPQAGTLPILYGELTLKGEVVQPDDLDTAEVEENELVYTGIGTRGLTFPSLQLRDLKSLASPVHLAPQVEVPLALRPKPTALSFPEPAARLGEVVAAGEHNLLLAGPPGSGKSTLAESLAAWLESPSASELTALRKLAKQDKRDLSWRPVSRPHHSITPLAMVGGGSSIWRGEIARAHGGVLVMDELLQFHTDIQDSLREPVETGQVTIVRAGATRTFAAQFLLVGTTNLCACGRFVPTRDQGGCRCLKRVRAKSLSRLTGPFVDRFSIFALSDDWQSKGASGGTSEGPPEVDSSRIEQRVADAIQFRLETRGQAFPNSKASAREIEESLGTFQRKELLAPTRLGSMRRKDAVLRVSRTLADLSASSSIRNGDLDEALVLCTRAHRLLEEYQD